MATIDDLSPDIVEDCRRIINDFDGQFAPVLQYLNIGIENEKIRWISKTPECEYIDVDKVKRMTWGKVSRSSAIYSNDTGNLYEVRINERIYRSMMQDEKKAFLFYLLAHIAITIDNKGILKFGVFSDYQAERIVAEILKDFKLPKASTLVERGTI